MAEKKGTRLRTPGDLRRYITKILCRMKGSLIRRSRRSWPDL